VRRESATVANPTLQHPSNRHRCIRPTWRDGIALLGPAILRKLNRGRSACSAFAAVPRLAVLVATDVRCRRGAHVSDGLNFAFAPARS
jgi:hypothetical protein